jgi:hypothetical protein
VGVLDELQKEADAIAAEKEREARAREEALEGAREQIGPRMQAAYKYFEQLKQHLLAVNREILAHYRIHGAGQVDGLLQGKYSVSTQTPDTLEKFSFRCVCAKSGAFQVNTEDPASAASYRDYLRDNGLKAKARDTGRGKTTFLVQNAVPVVVEFSADYERFAIAIRVRNLTTLGVTTHRLTPDQLDDKLLDEVAKAILRTDHRFEEMVGDVLSRTGQIRLKKKFREAVRQKEIEDEQYAPRPTHAKVFSKTLSRTLFGRKGDG